MIPTNEQQPTKDVQAIAPEAPELDAEPLGNTDTVPLDTLSMPDEKEQMTPPAVGDEVTYTVTGKVTAINGSNAVIERTSINGNDVGDKDADNAPDDEASLQAQAQGLDKGLSAQ